MATLNLKYYCGEDIYCDGSVEDEILDYYKNKTDLDLFREDTFYVTTNIRENIINWYPFKKNASALEIGGGMGPITKAICDKCKKVVSVENSKKRATILYERHKERDNLEVYAANIKDVNFEEKFDYIVLIGVFEYSKIFFDTDHPFEDFLNYLKTLIKDDGKILIAIENRYGLKYFAGVTEDHYSKQYIGLKGYENLKIQTLGMGEWKDLLKKCNITNYKFYYPVPDYKMPSVIYSEDYLPKITEIRKLPIFNYAPEKYLYDYREALTGIVQNRMFGFFANSFFVEIAKSETELSNVSFAKIQNSRNTLYKSMTIIYNDEKIFKYPLNIETVKFLKDLEKTHNKLTELKIKNSNIKFENNSLKIEHIDGTILSDYIYELYLNKNVSEIEKIIDEYYKFLLSISTKKKLIDSISKKLENHFKDKIYVLKYGLPDLNMSNVIKKENEFILIDQEFGTERSIPLDYVMYFSIDLLYQQIPELDEILKKDVLLEKYNFSQELVNLIIDVATEYFDVITFFDKKVNDYILEHSKIVLESELKEEQEKKVLELNQENEKIKEEIKILKQEIDNKNYVVQELEKNYNDVLNSKSWRYTKFLRKAKKILSNKK